MQRKPVPQFDSPEEIQPYKKVKTNNQDQEPEQDNYDDEDEEFDEDDLLQAIQEAEQDQNLNFDHDHFLKLINQFDKHILVNQQLRSQFKNKPEQFMESEIELDDNIRKFGHITAYPELFKIFNQSSAIKNIIVLIQHENNDIRVEVINFIKEITSLEFDKPDEIKYNQDVEETVDIFVQNGVCEALFELLVKLKEEKDPDDYDTLFKILEIFEAILDTNPEKYINYLTEKTKLLKWILNRIGKSYKHKLLDDNKLFSTEILTVLLTTKENQATFIKNSGISRVIDILAKYKSSSPDNEEEKEFVLNLFNCLCIVLMEKEAQEIFREKLGLDLMIKMIKEKQFCAKPALKTISFALSNNTISSSYFVDIQGLKFIIPVMIMKGIKSKKQEEQKLINEQVFSIIKSLILGNKDLNLERVINKFRENEYEKIDRLFELHNYYFGFINEIDRQMSNPQYFKTLLQQDPDTTEEEIRDNIYIKKQELGLNILEYIDFTIIYLIDWKDLDIQDKVKKILKMHEGSDKEILKTNKDYLQNIEEDTNEFKILSKRIKSLEKFIESNKE